MHHPSKIIFLTPGFPVNESDTTCIPALQDFVLQWKESFPAISFAVVAFQYPHQEKKYQWHGVPVYAAGGSDRNGARRLMTWTKVLLELRRIAGRKRVLIISYFLTEATYIAALFSRLSGIPFIAIAAGQDVKSSNHYLQKSLVKEANIVTFTEKMSNELERSTGRKARHVIPFGIKKQTGDVPVMNESFSDRPLDLLVVSALIPLKQVEVAIRIIEAVTNTFPHLKADITGDGIERKKLELLAEKLQLQENIRFSGRVGRVEVMGKMSRAKVLLHTSQYEGQSTVVSEALANGMTVVCFDIGRITDHQKIMVCRNEQDMINVLTDLFLKNRFDFSPVIPVTMEESVHAYAQIIGELF